MKGGRSSFRRLDAAGISSAASVPGPKGPGRSRRVAAEQPPRRGEIGGKCGAERATAGLDGGRRQATINPWSAARAGMGLQTPTSSLPHFFASVRRGVSPTQRFSTSASQASKHTNFISVKDLPNFQLAHFSGKGRMQEGWILVGTAAKRLAHGYHWMCRNWRGLELQRRQIGRAIFFRKADIASMIERPRPVARGPGRPRKIVGIIRPQG